LTTKVVAFRVPNELTKKVVQLRELKRKFVALRELAK